MHTLRGSLLRLLPRIATELVQRRGLGRCARVPRDEVEGVHRYIEFVCVGVLEHQELVGEPANIERRKTDESSDAIFLVNDRRARIQIGQVADDFFRVALRSSAPAFLTRTFAEQLFLCDQR